MFGRGADTARGNWSQNVCRKTAAIPIRCGAKRLSLRMGKQSFSWSIWTVTYVLVLYLPFTSRPRDARHTTHDYITTGPIVHRSDWFRDLSQFALWSAHTHVQWQIGARWAKYMAHDPCGHYGHIFENVVIRTSCCCNATKTTYGNIVPKKVWWFRMSTFSIMCWHCWLKTSCFGINSFFFILVFRFMERCLLQCFCTGTHALRPNYGFNCSIASYEIHIFIWTLHHYAVHTYTVYLTLHRLTRL